MNLWLLVAATIVGCYAEKALGWLLPERWLSGSRTLRLLEVLPVALLTALVVVQLAAAGRRLHVDPVTLAGFAAGATAVWRRAPFLVVVVVAGVTAALLRAL